MSNYPAFVDLSDFVKILNQMVDAYTKTLRFPLKATWHTSQFDIPVTLIGISGYHDNIRYYKIEGSNTSIPENELIF